MRCCSWHFALTPLRNAATARTSSQFPLTRSVDHREMSALGHKRTFRGAIAHVFATVYIGALNLRKRKEDAIEPVGRQKPPSDTAVLRLTQRPVQKSTGSICMSL